MPPQHFDELGLDGAARHEDRFVRDLDPNRVVVDRVIASELADRCRHRKAATAIRAVERAAGFAHLGPELLDEREAGPGKLELKTALRHVVLAAGLFLRGILGASEKLSDIRCGERARADFA